MSCRLTPAKRRRHAEAGQVLGEQDDEQDAGVDGPDEVALATVEQHEDAGGDAVDDRVGVQTHHHRDDGHHEADL